MFSTSSFRSVALLSYVASLIGCSDSLGTKGGELLVTASAEALGANGYEFPPSAGQETAFVDGWSLSFDRILVVIDNIRLSRVPDKNLGDQAEMGEDVVVRKGPFLVDLKGRGTDQDKGQAGKIAIRLPIEELKNQFELDQRYAFSFDLVEANEAATRVNVEPDDADVAEMVARGQRLLLTGKAVFKGELCQSSDKRYDFGKLPNEARFRFGLTGAVSYLNCQNPDNGGAPISGEESQRGIQMLPNGPTTAQVTIHTDHLFWSTVAHENLPRFDQFAANAVKTDDGYLVDLDDLGTVPLPVITDRDSAPLPWRSCVAESLYSIPSQPSHVSFESGGQDLSNLRDFVLFNAATMGHLNADGLCFAATE